MTTQVVVSEVRTIVQFCCPDIQTAGVTDLTGVNAGIGAGVPGVYMAVASLVFSPTDPGSLVAPYQVVGWMDVVNSSGVYVRTVDYDRSIDETGVLKLHGVTVLDSGDVVRCFIEHDFGVGISDLDVEDSSHLDMVYVGPPVLFTSCVTGTPAPPPPGPGG